MAAGLRFPRAVFEIAIWNREMGDGGDDSRVLICCGIAAVQYLQLRLSLPGVHRCGYSLLGISSGT